MSRGDEDEWDPASALVGDLPTPPRELVLNRDYVMARWVGPAFGAVRSWYRYTEDNKDLFDDDVVLFARVDDAWDEANGSGGGGGDYSERLLMRPDVGPRFVGLSSQHSHFGDGWFCTAVAGVAGNEARWVEVQDAQGVTRRPLESPLGYFVACADGGATFAVRVLDALGVVMHTEDVVPDAG